MKIIPAIDLINNKCVRLVKGDFEQKTIYSDDPISMAKKFEASGAKYLHVVDLDGAKNEESSQSKMIIEIAKNTNLKIQTGGGIRTADKIRELLEAKIDKIVIGSLAVKNPKLVKSWLTEFGKENFVLAFDVRIIDGIPYTSTSGWVETGASLWEILKEYDAPNILCTDIDKDGMLQGPNFNLYNEIKRKFPKVFLEASGGIATLENLKELSKNNIDGVIIGKALYENQFTLEEALKC